MPFTKDNPMPGPGRPKGSENKKTRDIKEVIEYLVDALQDGELDTMLTQLLADKPEAVLAFIGKIAPKKLEADVTAKTYTIQVEPEEADI